MIRMGVQIMVNRLWSAWVMRVIRKISHNRHRTQGFWPASFESGHPGEMAG